SRRARYEPQRFASVGQRARYGDHCLAEEEGRQRRAPALVGPSRQPTAPFVPLSVSASQPGASHDVIRLEVKRDTATVRVSWPISAAVIVKLLVACEYIQATRLRLFSAEAISTGFLSGFRCTTSIRDQFRRGPAQRWGARARAAS